MVNSVFVHKCIQEKKQPKTYRRILFIYLKASLCQTGPSPPCALSKKKKKNIQTTREQSRQWAQCLRPAERRVIY